MAVIEDVTEGAADSRDQEHDASSNGQVKELSVLFSKLNPMAKEFVPNSAISTDHRHGLDHTNGNTVLNEGANGNFSRKNKFGINQETRKYNSRTSRAQTEDAIRRTVYVSDIDPQVTEEQLAALFNYCVPVEDCRVCGDMNSFLRFAFVEFTHEGSAKSALSMTGTMLGYHPVKVLPSKTAITPVNPTFLPRTDDEWEMCTRTVYCTNIDKQVTQAELKRFFDTVCGEVYKMKLLNDQNHPSRVAFIEFLMANSAITALNCSGAMLGSLPIRVSPSKTPVRSRAPRPSLH